MYVQLNCVTVDANPDNRQELANFLSGFGVNVLARGWTITRHADGRIVRAPDDLDVGDVLITQFAAGATTSRVITGEDDA